MNLLETLSAKTDLTLTHQQGHIRISGHSTREGLLVEADSPGVLKAAIRTMKKMSLRNTPWRKTLKLLRKSPQSLEIRVKDNTLIAVGQDRVRIHYFRLLPYVPVLI